MELGSRVIARGRDFALRLRSKIMAPFTEVETELTEVYYVIYIYRKVRLIKIWYYKPRKK